MSINIIAKVLLLSIALAADAFAVSITDGLIYDDLNKKKKIFISLTFGLFQALMPCIGYFVVELITNIASSNSAKQAGQIMSLIVSWTAFSLLMIIGIKMVIESIIELRKNEEHQSKKFSYKEVIYFGVVTSIDALAAGVVLHANISTNYTVWLHILLIGLITFILSLIGVMLGNKIEKLLDGKHEIACVIGGIILILLAIWVILSHYIGE